MDDIFNRYAPLIQDYIYAHGWQSLRGVQEQAAELLFDTDDHLLICSSTASGKTEAAFFPVISTLLNDPSTEGFSVLYIAPLKSLINDQFDRLSELLDMSGIPLYHWHGDVSSSHKAKALKEPRGILQITPESLESMLINRQNDLTRLFGDLRFVIIDEVHALMGTDRGRQISCQLTRLDRKLICKPRRIGLSATIKDKKSAGEWLAAGTSRKTSFTDVGEERPLWRIGVEQFFIKEKETSTPADEEGALYENGDFAPLSVGKTDERTAEKTVFDPGFDYVYKATKNKSCILFSNSREETEYVTSALRQIAEAKNEEDRFLIHHGNLSAALREETERKLKNEDEGKYTACATVTLELGIDIGRLERVIQMDAPTTVSSFLQRLGRSGRRDLPPEMLMVIREEEPLPNTPLQQCIPWGLLRAIAIIQLYIEERFIEGPGEKSMPMSLLFQQTLSMLAANGELTPAALASKVLTLPPFVEVEKEDYRDLLRAMVAEDYISITEEKGLIVGLAGEKLTSSFKFYASFKDSDDFTVRWGSDEIGTITSAPPAGDRFALAGRVWEVEECDVKRKLIYVHPVKGRMQVSWPGDFGEIHTRILERMRQVLREDAEYPYLQKNALNRLKEARTIARNTGMTERAVVRLGGFSYCFFPWLGTKSSRTLRRLLKHYSGELGISSVEFEGCYAIPFKMEKGCEDDLPARLLALIERDGLEVTELVPDGEAPSNDKYDPLLPPTLLRKAYALDRLDLEEVILRLSRFS
ncbi:MAG: DEAD/DEAH box helicase [Clostridia bacterium]|nr:DEAD/DEAH box helicase [Clostridia bacterium]